MICNFTITRSWKCGYISIQNTVLDSVSGSRYAELYTTLITIVMSVIEQTMLYQCLLVSNKQCYTIVCSFRTNNVIPTFVSFEQTMLYQRLLVSNKQCYTNVCSFRTNNVIPMFVRFEQTMLYQCLFVSNKQCSKRLDDRVMFEMM